MTNATEATVEAVAETTEPKQSFLKRINIRSILPLLGFVLIFAFFAVATGGRLIMPNNLTLILNSTYVPMIAAIGVFMIMSMGSLDFSQGSMIGLSCIVVCLLSQISIPLAIIGGIATGAAVGACNAFFHVSRQIPSFIVTICMMFLVRGIVAFLTTEAPAQGSAVLQNSLNQPTILLPITLLCLILFYVIYTYTPLAATLRAIGASQTGARFAGIRVNRVKFLVYVAAGAITGFAAFILAIRNGSVTSTGGNMLETQIMLALVLGGLPITGGAKARFSNVPIGVLTYCVLDRGLVMMGFPTDIKQLITGIVFLAFLALFSDRSAHQVIK